MTKKILLTLKYLSLSICFACLNSFYALTMNLPSLNLKTSVKKTNQKISEEDKISFPNFSRDFALEFKDKINKKPTTLKHIVRALGQYEKTEQNQKFEDFKKLLTSKEISTHIKNSLARDAGLPVFKMDIFKTKTIGSKDISIVKLFSLERGSSEKAQTMIQNIIKNESFMTALARDHSLYCKVFVPKVSSWGIFNDFDNDDKKFNPYGYLVMTYLKPEQWKEFSKLECPTNHKEIIAKIIAANACLQKRAGLFHNDIYIRKETPQGVLEQINSGNIMLEKGGRRVALIDYGEAIPVNKENKEVSEAMTKVNSCKYFGKQPTHTLIKKPLENSTNKKNTAK